jgi:hypothetical protein
MIKANPEFYMSWLDLGPKTTNPPIFHNAVQKVKIQKLMSSVEKYLVLH